MKLKSGFLTSEFYVALAGIGTILVSFIQTNCSFDSGKVLALGGAVVAYILGRNYLKGKVLKQTVTPTANPATEVPGGQVV